MINNYIINGRLVLREASLEDTSFIINLNNNSENKKYFPRTADITKEQHLEFMELVKQRGDLYFVIDYYNFPISIPIGTVSIYDIDNERKIAEWGRFILDIKYRGYGVLVEKKIIEIAFKELGLKKLFCNTLSINERTIELHKLLGFKIETIKEKMDIVSGQYYNFVLMSIRNPNFIEDTDEKK